MIALYTKTWSYNPTLPYLLLYLVYLKFTSTITLINYEIYIYI